MAPFRVITVVLNPKSGTSDDQDTRADLARLFEAAGLAARVVSTGSAAEIAPAVRAAVAAGSSAVVAAGGDGTISRVASALAGSDTPLGVLPLGTLNHFARDLGIPIDLEQAVHTIGASHVTSIDVGEVNDRVFVNNSSIGIYPNIVLARDELRRQGYRKWTAFAVASANVLRRYRGVVVRIAEGRSTQVVRTPFLFIGNNEYRADGIHMGARARLDAGRLFAYFAPRLRGYELPALFARALAGRARDHHDLETLVAVRLRVDAPGRRRLRVALDGEVSLMQTPLHYRVRPLALKVIVPGP